MAKWVSRHPVAAFVVLAYTLSWAAWLPLLAQTQHWLGGGSWPVLHLLGSLGPAGSGVIVVTATQGRRGLGQLGRRMIAWRGRGRAWLFALGVPPLLLLVAVPVAAAAAADSSSLGAVDWSMLGRSTEFAAWPVAEFWLANVICVGFGEETGWRGFLQPHLERRLPPVAAANRVALVWAGWHVPLFGITPSYRQMPAAGFVGFAASIWIASFIFAWLHRAGHGSVLVVALFHSWFDVLTTSPLDLPLLPTVMGAAVTIVGLVVLRRLLAGTPTQSGPGNVSTSAMSSKELPLSPRSRTARRP